MPESVLDQGIQVNKEPDSLPAELDPPVKEEPTKEKPQITSMVQPLEETGAQNPVSASDAFPEGEEGWQAVHRLRSAGLHGRRLLTALTYIDKSVPSFAKESTEESGRDESNSPLEVGPVQTIGPTQELFYKPFLSQLQKQFVPWCLCAHKLEVYGSIGTLLKILLQIVVRHFKARSTMCGQ
ncbi:hypothetical protein Tco_1259878 [Tanacetum coccineum]